MTNEEFKSKHNEHLSNLIEKETAIINSIYEGIEGVELPTPAYTLKEKITELLNMFDSDGKDIDQHLTVVLGTNYLFAKYVELIQDIQIYFNNLFAAILNRDEEKSRELMEKGDNEVEKWNNMDSYIKDFDYQNNLQELLDSGIHLPNDMPKEDAYKICMNELNVINYTPKEKGTKTM